MPSCSDITLSRSSWMVRGHAQLSSQGRNSTFGDQAQCRITGNLTAGGATAATIAADCLIVAGSAGRAAKWGNKIAQGTL
jgi:hypothetical protein